MRMWIHIHRTRFGFLAFCHCNGWLRSIAAAHDRCASTGHFHFASYPDQLLCFAISPGTLAHFECWGAISAAPHTLLARASEPSPASASALSMVVGLALSMVRVSY